MFWRMGSAIFVESQCGQRSPQEGGWGGVVRDEFDQLQNACDPEDPCDLDDADHPRVRVGGCSAHPLFDAILWKHVKHRCKSMPCRISIRWICTGAELSRGEWVLKWIFRLSAMESLLMCSKKGSKASLCLESRRDKSTPYTYSEYIGTVYICRSSQDQGMLVIQSNQNPESEVRFPSTMTLKSSSYSWLAR